MRKTKHTHLLRKTIQKVLSWSGNFVQVNCKTGHKEENNLEKQQWKQQNLLGNEINCGTTHNNVCSIGLLS